MSYCRFSNADAYIFLHDYGLGEPPRLCCLECRMDNTKVLLGSAAAMLGHIAAHRIEGHHIPTSVDDAIRADAARWGDSPETWYPDERDLVPRALLDLALASLDLIATSKNLDTTLEARGTANEIRRLEEYDA